MVHRLQVAVVRSDSVPKCPFSRLIDTTLPYELLPSSSTDPSLLSSATTHHHPTNPPRQTPLINQRSASLVFAPLAYINACMHTYRFRLCIRFSFPVHTTSPPIYPSTLSSYPIKLTPPPHSITCIYLTDLTPIIYPIIQLNRPFIISQFIPLSTMYVDAV